MADKLMKTLNFGTGDTYHPAPKGENIQTPVPIDKGGTGATNAATARTNLGIGSNASDSGKILMVNSSGVPVWTTITNAEGVAY